MANQEQLDILRQGVDVWNKWRMEYPDICPDLREAELNKPFFEDPDIYILSNANLKNADLGKALQLHLLSQQ